MNSVADSTIAKIEAFAMPLITDLDLELVEVQYRREAHGWVLRIFIDSEKGVKLDDCSAVSRQVGAHLDVEDIIEEAYTLEVSSPGVERPLVKDEDYERFKGRKARVKLIDPLNEQRVFIGTLKGLDGEAVVLQLDDETIRLDLKNIKRARLSL